MARVTTRAPDLVIQAGATVSNAMLVPEDAEAMQLFSPAVLAETVTIEVEPSKTGNNWVALLSGGSAINIPVGSSIVLTALTCFQLRLKANVGVAAARTFAVCADISL